MKTLFVSSVLAFLVAETVSAESSCPPDCGFKIQFCNDTPADLGIRVTTTAGRLQFDNGTVADDVDKSANVNPGQCSATIENRDPGSKCVRKVTDGLVVAHADSKAKDGALHWEIPDVGNGKCYGGLATLRLKFKPGVDAEQFKSETYASKIFDLTVETPSTTPAERK